FGERGTSGCSLGGRRFAGPPRGAPARIALRTVVRSAGLGRRRSDRTRGARARAARARLGGPAGATALARRRRRRGLRPTRGRRRLPLVGFGARRGRGG